MERVVCISDTFFVYSPHPKKGEIYEIDGLSLDPEFKGWYHIKGFNRIQSHGYRCAYNPQCFRPICDDGYVLCEYIENVDFKQYQLEEATTP